MDWREEAWIGCSIMMIGTALSTLSSLTGLQFIGQAGVGLTLMVGLPVLAMVAAAGNVLVNGTYSASGIATLVGMGACAVGWFASGQQFLWAFPGMFALFGLLSAAFARPMHRDGDQSR